MATAKQRANWARFARMAKARARKRRGAKKRPASRSRPRRSPRRGRSKKVRTMARRTRRRGKSRGGKQKASWVDLAAHANTAFQVAEPLAPALDQAMAGDVKGAITTARPALAEIASPRNIVQIAVPYAVRGLAKKALRMFGARAPKFGGRRLF